MAMRTFQNRSIFNQLKDKAQRHLFKKEDFFMQLAVKASIKVLKLTDIE